MYVHCNECHHEWECTNKDRKSGCKNKGSKCDFINTTRRCNWCGGGSYILENDPNTNFIDGVNGVLLKLEKMNNPYADKIIKKLIKKKK
jgi:hypothetical protein